MPFESQWARRENSQRGFIRTHTFLCKFEKRNKRAFSSIFSFDCQWQRAIGANVPSNITAISDCGSTSNECYSSSPLLPRACPKDLWTCIVTKIQSMCENRELLIQRRFLDFRTEIDAGDRIEVSNIKCMWLCCASLSMCWIFSWACTIWFVICFEFKYAGWRACLCQFPLLIKRRYITCLTFLFDASQ